MAHEEYPKQLYRQGWANLDDSVVVNSVEQEESARADGFKHLAEFGEEYLTENAAPKRGRKKAAE